MNTRRMYRSVRWLVTTGLLLTVILTLAGPASVARAASYVVSNLNDSGAGSLRQAIEEADATAGADTITFSVSGTIVLSETLLITDAAGLTIDGAGQSITISGNGAVRVMVTYGALTLHNLTIADGYYPYHAGGIANYGTLDVTNTTFSGNVAETEGGGILSYGTLTVTDSVFSGNSAEFGGAILGGTLTVTDSTFSGNTAVSEGGAIWNGGGMLTVTGSAFSLNGAGQEGGGIYNTSSGTLEVINSTFSENSAGFYGGGIDNGGTGIVANSTFSGNSTGDRGGGGIYNTGTLEVTGSTFSGNSVFYNGGGILNDGNGTLTVTDSTFSANSAYVFGGGISNGIYGYAGGTLTVTNSTFSGNSTGDPYYSQGGGIFNSGVLDVTNSTLSGNSAPVGGGIYNSGDYNSGMLTLQNTIVANSTGENCSNSGSLIDGGGNLSWPDTSCPGLNAAPLLGPLQDNGGPTQTLALLPGSPAIDAALLANCPATDQRGVSRPQGPGCDIGAFELEVVYNFRGFFQPVDNLPTFNIVKAGVSVPVKFSLGGDQGLDIFAAGYPISKRIACESGAPQDGIERTVTAGSSSLSYNATTGIYTYVWKTNAAWAGTCRQLIVKLNDGTEHRANFKFVK